MSTIDAPSNLARTFRAFARVLAVLVIGVGGIAIVDWLFGTAIFKSLLPGFVTMKFNTALAFVLVGIALICLHREPLRRQERRMAGILATIIIMIGLLTLSEYLFGWSLSIDQLLIADLESSVYPGRMSPVTALNFLLLGLSLLFLAQSRYYRAVQALGLGVGFVSLLAVIGYLYGVSSLYQISPFIPIALHTAITFILASLSSVMTKPDYGPMAIFASDTIGGFLARRLLPAAVILPIVFGWLRLTGQRLGVLNLEFGLSLTALANIIVFGGLIAWMALFLHQIDLKRYQAERALREANDALESRVRARTIDLADANQQLELEMAERSKAEGKFRALLESAPDAMVIANEQGAIELVNSQVEKLFGYGRDELFGQAVEKLIPEVYSSRHPSYRDSYYSDPRVRDMSVSRDLYALHKDGTQFPVEIRLSPIQTAEGLLIASAVRDISERKQAEEALRKSEESYRQLFNQIDDYILIHDKDSQIIDVNQAASDQLGYTRQELLSMRTVDLDAPDYATGFYERLEHQLTHGRLMDIEGVHIAHDGQHIPILVNSRTIIYKGQEAVLAICRDMTEYKSLQQRILQLEKDRQQVRLLSDFVQSISHDFRTPLTVISTSLHLLQYQTDPEQKKLRSAAIETQIEHLTKLLDRSLMMARLDSEIVLHFQSLGVNTFVRNLGSLIESQAEDKQLELLFSLNDNLRPVQADVEELEQAFYELLNNAAQYTPNGGKITLRTYQLDKYVGIEIRDTGLGIPEADLPYIFDRLYRVDQARPTGEGHIGLGLALAKKICDLHGGKLEVESELGVGSYFRVLLPVES